MVLSRRTVVTAALAGMAMAVGVASVPRSDLIGQEGDVLTLAVGVDAMRDFEARMAETGRGH